MDELTTKFYDIVTDDMFYMGIPPTLENLIGHLIAYEAKIHEEVQNEHSQDLYAYRYLMAIRLELARLYTLLPQD